MSLNYRTVTYDATEPTVNYTGDIWIQKIDNSYQANMYIGDTWRPILSGGIGIDETDPDDHFINVFTQNIEPQSPKNGWFWIHTTTEQIYIYLNGFFPIGG